MATALNHAKVIKGIEKILAKPTPGDAEFIYEFLSAYEFPKATINRLKADEDTSGKRGTSSRNVATIPGDLATRLQFYYRPVMQGIDLTPELENLKKLPVIESQRIRFLIVSDGVNLAAWDKRVDDSLYCTIEELLENYEFFLPLTGKYEKALATSIHPADLKACEKMGKLYELLKDFNGYEKEDSHAINVFLMRLIFCFFADDTGIFPIEDQTTNAVESLTLADGTDVDALFSQLFEVLDMPEDDPRRKNYNATLQAFPYVGGNLFKEQTEIPKFNAKARRMLIEGGRQVWAEISPVVFGAMFQTAMDPVQRRELGAHYTSEINIHKVIDPLFVDDLKAEFESACDLKEKRTRIQRLNALWDKIANLGCLDPACGSGNFLVVAYRELRLLEMQIIKQLQADDAIQGGWLDVGELTRVSINQFYGIEIEELPCDIARVSMCLMEHLMNLEMGKLFGQSFPTIPLKNAAKIVCTNALTTDWKSIVKPEDLNYIFGNPPFAGTTNTTAAQKKEIDLVFNGERVGYLDYVGCWYMRATQYIKGTPIETAFVSTNSICQGQQVEYLWGKLFQEGICINFMHQTFRWENEAKNKAAVYCVIVGFSHIARARKYLFSQFSNRAPFITVEVKQISPYGTEGSNAIVISSDPPLSGQLGMIRGNIPTDGGNLIIEPENYDALISLEEVAPFIKKLTGAKELLHSLGRWCLWLGNAPQSVLSNPQIHERIKKVKAMRLASKAKSTQEWADRAHLFRQITQHSIQPSLVIPGVSSERREYIPMAFVDENTVVTNSAFLVPNATLYDFGILTSRMHMVWMRTVCGRLKSDYRYSRDLCYNTFYWPEVTEQQKAHISELAQEVLDARDMYGEMTLADLYDPDKMPAELREAHTALDLAVDRLYQSRPFDNDEQRLRLLLKRYQQLIGADTKDIDPDED